jgi:hypothetical protein
VRSDLRRPGHGIAPVVPIAVALLAVLAGNAGVLTNSRTSDGPPTGHVSDPAAPPIRELFPALGAATVHGSPQDPSPLAIALGLHGPRFEPSPAELGHQFLIVTNVTGGQPPYMFRYTGLPVGCASQNLSEFACRANATGNYTVVVNVTDVAGAKATSNAELRVRDTGAFYEATWQESGLPTGTQWGVTIFGTQYNATSRQLQVYLYRGYYPYSVEGVPGYDGTPSEGSVVINDSFPTIFIAFTRALYPVTFLQSGLPVGTPWSVTAAGQMAASTNDSAELALPNGTTPYSVAPPMFWRAIPPSGNLTILGAPGTVYLTFVPIPTFAVSFVASGLPAQSVWSVNVNGTRLSSELSNISTVEPNGSYPYFVHPPAGWTAIPDQGNLSVDGKAVQRTISIAFYRLTLHEMGLPQGTNWSALVNGSLLSGTTVNLTEGIPAGRYEFGVSAIPGWTATPGAGSIVVGPGSSGVADVTFAGPVERSNVTFLGSGLPSNLSWSVSVDGQIDRAGIIGLVLQLQNGSYPYGVSSPAGWVASPSNGTVVVNGKPADVQIVFAIPAPPTPSLLGLDPQAWVTFTAALGSSLIAGVVAGAAAARLRFPRG